MTRLQLEAVVPEAFQARRWADLDAEAFRSDLEDVDDAVSFLRSADFAGLTKSRSALTVASAASAEAGEVEPERTSAELVDITMESDLARELVEHGYPDRNFALHAAKFYGTFTGVNVANFLVQNAETNRMEVDFELSGDGAVANLLDEADEEVTRKVASLLFARAHVVLPELAPLDDALRLLAVDTSSATEHGSGRFARIQPWNQPLWLHGCRPFSRPFSEPDSAARATPPNRSRAATRPMLAEPSRTAWPGGG